LGALFYWPVVVGIAGSLAYMLAHGLVDHGYFLVDLAFAFHLLLALAQTDPFSWVRRDRFSGPTA